MACFAHLTERNIFADDLSERDIVANLDNIDTMVPGEYGTCINMRGGGIIVYVAETVDEIIQLAKDNAS